MYQRFLFMIGFSLWAISGWSQTPMLPSFHGGDQNRTLDLREASKGSWQPIQAYDYNKINNRRLEIRPKTRNCLTTEVNSSLQTTDAGAVESPEAFEEWMEESVQRQQQSRSIFRRGNTEIYTLPVVVHIVYSNSTENISDEQVYSQIKVLNQDYRRTNPDQSLTDRNFKTLAVDTGIEFCLATIDPDGNATNGIDRVSYSGSPFDEQTINQSIKPATIWDPNRYFNIWVCSIADGVLGFAQFPISSGLTGIPNLPTSHQTEGVVINYFTFGTMGTVSSPFDKGRTTTHEVGHWLGLRHVWGDGPCGVDDYCEDTPMTAEANFSCPSEVMSCDGTRAMVQNFMEYTNDACMNLFTSDQRNRMRTVLENSPRRKNLLTSNACQAVAAPPKADFVADVQSGCSPLTVNFQNRSTGKPDSYSWFFPGGKPSSSSKPNPSVNYRKPGLYPVTLQVSNAGGPNSKTIESYIHVREAGIGLPYVADFEWEENLSSAVEQIHNPEGDQSWALTRNVSAGGKGALTINNYDNQLKGSLDWFVSPVLDLSGENRPVLSFDVAYAPFSDRYSDTLAVFIATSCGTTFRNIYFKGGAQLSTIGQVQQPFSPHPDEWRTEWIDLSAYAGQSNVQVAFVNRNGNGNDVYLDNIRIGKMPPPKPISAFTPSQTAFCAGGNVQFSDQSQFSPDRWVWSFPGGIPASSREQNPSVKYDSAGVFAVTLTTFTEGGSHTLTKEAAIEVKAQPNVQLSSTAQEICAGQEVTLSVAGLTSPRWTMAKGSEEASGNQVTVRPANDATYRVYGSAVNGCQATKEITIRVRRPKIPLQVLPSAVTICEGESVSLQASGGSNYRWTPAVGLSHTNSALVQASPRQSMTYVVSGKVDNGCEMKTSVSVTVDPAPRQVNIVSDRQVLCPGETATLTASGAASYTWLTGNGLNARQGAQVKASPAASTNYTVRAASSGGCTTDVSYRLEVGSKPSLLLTSSDVQVCAGTGIQLAAQGAERYEWSQSVQTLTPQGSRAQATPSQNTRYTVRGFTEAGCSDTTSIAIAVLPVVPTNIRVSNPTICRGGNSTLEVEAPAGSQFSWQPKSSLASDNRARVVASPRRKTTYTVEVRQPNGCQTEARTDIDISRGQRPEAAFISRRTVGCVGEKIEFIDQSAQATEYFWEFPSGYPSTSREANPKVQFFEEGVHDVFLRVTGCSGDIDQMARYGMIEINSTFELSLNQSDLTICRGEKVDLQAGGADSYEWSPANGLSSSQGARVVATPSVSTTYTVVGRNQSGCQASQEITLAVAGEAGSLQLTPFAPTICQGEKIELQASGGISYFWTPEQHIDHTFGERVLVNPRTTTTYRVEATTSDGCVIRDSIRVQVRKVTPLKISPAKAQICAGEQVVLSLNQTGAYRWTPASSLSIASGSKVTAFPKQNTVYSVRGTDQYGCPGEASVTVQVGTAIPFVASVQDSVICQGGKTLLTATGGLDYEWSPASGLNQTTGAMVTAAPIQTTTYTVTSAGGSCGSERTLTVVVRPSNLLRIEPRSPNLCRGQSVELKVTGGNPRTYIWDNQEGLSTVAGAKVQVRPQQTISYKVRGLDEFLCEVEGSVTVQVADQNFLEVAAQQRNICSEEGVILEAKGANSYEWLATGQTTRSISVAPKEETTYQVVGILGPGCRDTASVAVSVGQLAGDFQLSTDRIDLAKEAGVVQFTDLTPGAISWKWEFAGRSTSEQKNPRHAFSEVGTQSIRLLVSNGTCQAIISKEIEVVNSSSLADLETEGKILVSSRTEDGIIEVNMDLPRAMLLQMRLLNHTGTELASGALRLKPGPYEQKLSLAGLPENTYTFELSDGVAVRRFPVAYDKGK